MTKDKSTGFSHKKRFLMPTFFYRGMSDPKGVKAPLVPLEMPVPRA